MYSDISTSRLLLRSFQTNEEGSIDLERFHSLWSNEQATKWSKRGACKTLAESKAWMAGFVPLPMPTSDTRVSYAVLYAESSSSSSSDGSGGRRGSDLIHPTDVDESAWKTAGIVTLLPTSFRFLEGGGGGGGEKWTYARRAGADDDVEPYGAVELGCLFAPEVWGRGFATESVRAVLAAYRRDIQPSHALFPREILAWVHEKNVRSRRVLEKAGFREECRVEAKGWLPLVEDARKHIELYFRMVE